MLYICCSSHRSAQATVVMLLLGSLSLIASCSSASPSKSAPLAQRLTIVDTHIDVPFRLHRAEADLELDNAKGEFDFPKAARGGLDAAFMSIYIPASVDAAGGAAELADKLIDDIERLAAKAPAKFSLAYCAADVERAKKAGQVALPLGMENGGPIAGDMAQLAHFRERGIRYITLTHSKVNHISDSSYDSARRWHGLSPFGVELVAAMNQQGVLIDVSHISDEAFWQVMQLSATPVIASHSSLRHFTPGFERNMSDAMVAALGQSGGVVQINFGSGFLTQAARDWSTKRAAAATDFMRIEGLDPANADTQQQLTAFNEQYREDNPYPFATIGNVLDHIDRAVKLAGINGVGLGSDYDGVGDSLPTGLKHVGQYPALLAGLQARGYSDVDIGKIAGGNVLRVWRAAEDFAAKSGTPTRCANQ